MKSSYFAVAKQRVWLLGVAAMLVLLFAGVGTAFADPPPTPLTSVACPTTLGSCTAGDVTTTVVNAIPVSGDTCTDPADTIQVDVYINYTSTAAERYDFGIYYATDGGPVNNGGQCVGAIAPIGGGGVTPPGAVFTDEDAVSVPLDVCGDLKKSIAPNGVTWAVRLTLPCIPDANNNLVTKTCRVWSQSKNDICTSLITAIAGTGSKCDCADLTITQVNVPFAATVTVNKVVVPADDTGKFNLQIDGSTKGTGGNVGNGGTTGPVSVSAGTAAILGATHTIGETAGTGTSLVDYNSSISCTCTGSTGTPCPTPATVGPFDGTSLPQPLTVNKDQNWVCTITNTTATITVDKNTVPAGAGHVFDFLLTGTPDAANNESFTLTDASTNVSYKVRPGTIVGGVANLYTLTELQDTGWTLTAASCVIRGTSTQVGTPSLPGLPGVNGGVNSIPVTAGQTIDCTLTNTVGPTAVTLASFSAAAPGNGVLVDWETAQETQNQGFNLWRGTSPAGPDIKLNAAIIPSQNPGGTMGASYQYVDTYQLTSGTTYYYWLEDVSLSGSVMRHEPVSVPYNVPTAVRLAGPRAAGSLPAAWPLASAALLALGAAALIRRRTA